MPDQPSDHDFEPITPNPYIVGNPVRDRSMFFGREAEFELVRRSFQPSQHAGLLVFCGERRSGKTSILFQIVDQRLGPDFIPVLIDMQSMAVRNEIEFLTRISEDVVAAVNRGTKVLVAPRFGPDANNAAIFQKFVREVLLAHPGKKLILLFDEYELLENKIDSGQLGEDVLNILANLMENQPVYLIFTGSQHIEQRRREYWKILAKAPLFRMISFLEREDALSLIRKPVEGRVQFAESTVAAIYRLTAGQPFYTQAVCQSLVDQLNERRTNHATPMIVAEVVDGIVNNPLPQMIFLWDGLERDEKLVLALLAESLPDEHASAAVADLTRLLRQRRYPRALDRVRIATTLEKLFKSEMLLRSDRGSLPAYSFRMDLWRLWVRRQHSFWQVLFELGIPRRGPSRVVRQVVGAAALAVVAVVLGWWAWKLIPRKDTPSDPTAKFTLSVEPPEAMIRLNDKPMGTGLFSDWITPEQDYRFGLTAGGYVDSVIPVRLAPGQMGRQHVRLRALLGDLRVVTLPAGAEIRVDGRILGPSPQTVGLAVTASHRVEASLSGYEPQSRVVKVEPGALTPVELTLVARNADVQVTSDPSGSEIRLDGRPRGTTSIGLPIPFGRHTLAASHPGYLQRDTTLEVRQDTRQIHVVLEPEPPGILVVQGERPANIYVAGRLVGPGVPNSGPQELARGTYPVRVILGSGENIDTLVVVNSRERVTFDYSRRTVTRSPSGGP